jgi:hypothetical protein
MPATLRAKDSVIIPGAPCVRRDGPMEGLAMVHDARSAGTLRSTGAEGGILVAFIRSQAGFDIAAIHNHLLNAALDAGSGGEW